MRVEILHRPAHALAVVHLEDGEQVRAEAGAMVSMSAGVQVRTENPLGRRSGGLLRNLKRAVLAGETFFTNVYAARGGPGEVALAPALCGDLVVHELQPGQDLLIQASSYLAAPDTVQIDTRFEGLKALLSGESFFFLRATGHGPVVLNAFGGIEALDVDGSLILDTGHLVALSGGLQYRIGKAARGWIQSWLSGEGFVLDVRGRGRLYVQTRNPTEYGTALGRLLPPRRE